ncbi:MAG: adenylyltransferase/cytidyltransferase family protein [Eubacteriales bacterium]|nr:adenylyltransferase/cytidyltransferase family protein [Eubacteriales bacterium]
MKPYKLGILVGRFQVLHKGHESMVLKAMELCERVAVFVGSSQESGTASNPFSYEERKSMLRAVFKEDIEIYPLPDAGLGNVSAWGEYVLEHVKNDCGMLPDLLISGKEARRQDWFDEGEGKNIAELSVPKYIEISASTMREYLINDDYDSWKEYICDELIPMYDTLREIVIKSKDNKETSSI